MKSITSLTVKVIALLVGVLALSASILTLLNALGWWSPSSGDKCTWNVHLVPEVPVPVSTNLVQSDVEPTSALFSYSTSFSVGDLQAFYTEIGLLCRSDSQSTIVLSCYGGRASPIGQYKVDVLDETTHRTLLVTIWYEECKWWWDELISSFREG